MGSLVMEPEDLASYVSVHHNLYNVTHICMDLSKIQSRGIFSNPLDYAVPLLLAQASVASAFILFISLLLRHLGQPSMVPQILGGLLLGPSFLGGFQRFSALLYPLKSIIMLDTLSIFGYIFFFFLVGVQVDPWIVLRKIGKREFMVGISTVALAMILSIPSSVLIMVGKMISVQPNTATSLPVVATMSSVLAFPIVAHYLIELKMANSEFGRMALSSSMISNLFGVCVITITALKNEHGGDKSMMFKTILAGTAMALVIFLIVRPLILWRIRRTQAQGKMERGFICVLFIVVLLSAFFSQAIGLHIIYGPLLFGLAIPAGPPLGSALVEKLELLNSWMFMPLYFLKNGLAIDIFSVKFKEYVILQFIILVAFTGKFLGALLSSIYWKVHIRDAISLGLVMNIQGLLELGMFKMMKQADAINNEAFVVLCTSMVIVTATITPLLRHLYDPSRRYITGKRRTVLHSKPDSELRVLVCVHDQHDLPSTINFLEAINPTKRTPIAIYILHLVELVGRAHPLLISHKLTKVSSSKASTSKSIVYAFQLFEQTYHGSTSVHPFTAISPYSSMHDEICTMALDKRVSLLIVPFHRGYTPNCSIESIRKGVRIVNNMILDRAPCSLAMVVGRGLVNTSRPVLDTWSMYRVAVFFLGGDDDREALALGARMAGQPNVNLTIIRLLENENAIGEDASQERALDNVVVSDFRTRMARNDQVLYIEEVVMDGSGTVAVIRSMENNYELIIVGRRHDAGSPLVLGLSGWNEETQLGAIGEMFASTDFNGNATILVVQQHTNTLEEWDESKKGNLQVPRGSEEAHGFPFRRSSASSVC